MSSAIMFGRNRLAFADLLHHGVGIHLVGHHVIDRQQELHVVALRFRQQLPRQIDFVGFQQRFADLLALRLEEGVRHAAADDQSIHLVHQVLDDADLVADFGAAENRDERLFADAAAPCPDIRSSFSISSPAADFCTNCVMPTVEAWARCAVPKASLT